MISILVLQFLREGERKYLYGLKIPCCKYAQTVDKGLPSFRMQPWVWIISKMRFFVIFDGSENREKPLSKHTRKPRKHTWPVFYFIPVNKV
jgi:hypothetical protein